jgi:hypothetical protein
VGAAIETVVQELKQRGFDFEKRVIAQKPGIWWCDAEVGSLAAC